ncbi:MAG: hypothetical protein H0X65_04060 [Gemmatimonadetes bacterium]|nr:hypothetical protein [Gemmatimonadota bacterium]
MVRLASLVAVATLFLSGCVYSFTGGGLPRHIRTIAIIPFENVTPQAGISTDLYTRMQQQLPRDLGVRLAEERVADAVIRGRIVAFDEPPVVARPTQPGQQLDVVQAQVRVTVEAEIYDLRENRPLWANRSLSVIGNYRPDQEQLLTGQARAIEEITRRIIEGAQSQW